MTTERTITLSVARRLAIMCQRLAGPRPSPDRAGVMDVMRALGCVQLDPISAVARSHLLVLWSRLGGYDPACLDGLLWQERRLFEYWAHAASIVLTEDYPIHHTMMQSYGADDSPRGRRRAWVEQNAVLRDSILARIRQEGPLPSRAFDDRAEAAWHSTGWTSGRNASQMLDYLWTSGAIMVAGRAGIQKLWDLSERCLPEWTPRDPLSEHERVRRAAQSSLRALGVATGAQIGRHYIRGRYPGLAGVLRDLEAEQRIMRVCIQEEGTSLPGVWYVHADDLPLLDRLAAGDWQPRTTLLSPFDNLICDRARTETLFRFVFRVEIYTPAAKRRHGYYVLPILHGDRLIGRIDPVYDRRRHELRINAVHAEPDHGLAAETGHAIAAAIADLAAFLGATTITYAGPVPPVWVALDGGERAVESREWK